ncbi:MAG TPA: GntR family transcriptional regulator [Dongiaceae bacterium]|nr:GntR family transcriptional regulator [Dongiaceae bacterium]
MFSIDHQSAVPLRAQVEELLRNLIRQPEYQLGALLPDELRIAAQLGISRGTVRSSIARLVHEGLLERKAGVGTRVVAHQAESGIQAWRSFTREMAAKGITVQNFRAEYKFAFPGPNVAQALQLDNCTRVWHLARVRGWNDKPVLQTISWFHPRLGLDGSEVFDRPIYEVVEAASGVRPHHATEEFSATTADARMARLLEVKRGTPLLLRRHTVFDPGNRPFEYAEICYVSSRFELTLDLRRDF